MRKSIFKTLSVLVAACAVAVMSGCAATQLELSKHNLDVQTKMSNTVFLDPVSPDKKTIVIQVRNTSDKPDFQVDNDIRMAIAAKGYTVVDDPDKAHYMLQVNVLQVGKTDEAAAARALGSGFGGIVTGAAVAGAMSRNPTNRSVLAGGIIGGAIDSISGALVKDVYYAVITDLQISERLGAGKSAKTVSENRLAQGSSGTTTVSSSEDSSWKRYQTRIMSSANKVNLDFAEALPELKRGLTTSISGLF
jgi:hypothetical protein